MKNFVWIILALGIISTPPSYASGGMEGGGGVGVLCSGNLEILDEHEARINGLQTINFPNESEESINLLANINGMATYDPNIDSIETYNGMIKHLIISPMFYGEPFLAGFEPDGELILAPFEFVDHLEISKDIGEYKVASGCKLIQIAYFEDKPSPKLKVVQNLWNKLSIKSKAFLITHESLYASQRAYEYLSNFAFNSTSNSAWVRSYVGKLLSKRGVTPLLAELINKSGLRCVGSVYSDQGAYTSTDFYIFEENNNTKIIYDRIMKMGDFYQIASYLPNHSLSSLESAAINAKIHFVDSNTESKLLYKITPSGKDAFIGTLYKMSGNSLVQVGKNEELFCDTFNY